MNRYGSWSPLLAIGRQLLAGKGNIASFPFSQQLFNFAGNFLKQKGGEFLKGLLEQPDTAFTEGSAFSGFEPPLRQRRLSFQQGQPGIGPQFKLFNGNSFAEPGQINPVRRLDLNQVNDQNGPTGATTSVQQTKFLTEEEIVQKYLQLLDRTMAKQSSFQEQLSQYRTRLTELQEQSPQSRKQEFMPRRFLFRNTHAGGSVNTLQEVDNWLNSAWQEMERENRAILAESRNLTSNLYK